RRYFRPALGADAIPVDGAGFAHCAEISEGSDSVRPMNRVVLHYHEIALKGGNRRVFVRQLVENLRRGLAGTGVHRVRSTPGRIVIALQKRCDWPEMQRRLARTYGVVNFSPALRAEPEMEAMKEAVLRTAEGRQFRSFAVRTRRADKTFPMKSP